MVSHRVTEGQDLEGLVIPDIIPTLQDRVSKMSLAQRDLIPVEVDDIYFSFPYQVYQSHILFQLWLPILSFLDRNYV